MARLRSNIARPARLTAVVTAAVTTLPVSTTDGWPDPGPGDEALGCISYPDIDRIELFTYTGKTDDSFTGVTRGVDDTSPRAHRVRALVVHVASADDLAGVSALADLDDVDVTGVADGDVLLYDTGTSTWGPGTASTVAAALACGFDPTGLAVITTSNVQDALEELDAAVDAVPTLASGSYTPTGTTVTNLDSITPGLATWTRVGDIVSVAGFFAVNHTANGAQTVARLSLPVASALAAQDDLGGACGAEDNLGGMVEADDTNNEALFRWRAPTSATRFIGYSYQYRVL